MYPVVGAETIHEELWNMSNVIPTSSFRRYVTVSPTLVITSVMSISSILEASRYPSCLSRESWVEWEGKL